MSRYHECNCYKPCRRKAVRRVRRRRPAGAGILPVILLVLGASLLSPGARNINKNIININSDNVDDVDDVLYY
jgi:hypothetical protein